MLNSFFVLLHPATTRLSCEVLKSSSSFSHLLLLSPRTTHTHTRSQRHADGCDNIGLAAKSQGHHSQHNANGNGGGNNNDHINHIRSAVAQWSRRLGTGGLEQQWRPGRRSQYGHLAEHNPSHIDHNRQPSGCALRQQSESAQSRRAQSA